MRYLMVFALVVYVSGCPDTTPKCIKKGRAYYKEIGSYPKLSDGRDAEFVISEKCARSLEAFGSD